MFIKRARGGTKEKPINYLQLVKSYRDKKGKPRHKILCNLGREEDLIDSDLAINLAEKFSALSNRLILIDKEQEAFSDCTTLGTIIALQTMWKKLKIDKMLSRVKSEENIDWDFENAVKLMVLNRIFDPRSKLGTIKWKDSIHCSDFENIELHHLYNSLDVLYKYTSSLQEELFKTSESLFKPNVKLVFYDLTTLYFESQSSDELKTFGYSKDNKTDCVQVVLSLAISEDNIPLYFEVYPGNTYEGNTVKSTVEELKSRFNIEKIVLVGDKGILSKKVIEELDNADYEYIIASKLQSLPKKYHSDILDKDSYTMISESLYLKEISIDGKRLVLGWSEKRAARDLSTRNTLLNRLSKKLNQDPKSAVAKSSYKKYLDISKMDVSISPEKIQEKSKWDGFFGFITNNENLSTKQVIDAYRTLWQIEESFRVMKSTLNIRPVFHWTEKRIKGHIMMCFLSFYIFRIMQRLVSEKSIKISNSCLIETLSSIKAIKIQDKKAVYIARTQISGQANEILRAIGCKIPSVILKEIKM